MWIVSFTVFLCACFACYDWFHIYLKTEGATCSGGGACVSDPKVHIYTYTHTHTHLHT